VKKSIFIIFLIFASSYLWAEEIPFEKQSLSVLKNKIERYMLNQLAGTSEGKVKISTGKLDDRIKLKICSDDHLEIFNPYDTAMLDTRTLGIKCLEETNHWSLYIPVKVSILKTVLLTKKALRKGDKINSEDLYQAEMDAQRLKQGYFTNAKELTGLVCKRDIAPDTAVNPYNIELERVVLKGQEVSIVASQGNLKISMDGIAMSDGVLGDVIKVKNTKSKRIIEAQVTGKKMVAVTL
jgi:flagella basal body P-ring formation protein FlgA